MTRRLLNDRSLPVLVILALFLIMFGWGSVAYTGFFSVQNFLNLFIDNAYLLILAVGMTFVIISGGIDLSVGSMLGLATMIAASLLEKQHLNPLLVILIVLLVGTALGFFMGCLIQFFDLPPFIITLAGLYLGRGLCYVVSIDTIAISDKFFQDAAHSQVKLIGDNFLSPSAVIGLVVVAVGAYVLHYTRFGRTVYAIGGNEQSALLMGLPVARTKIGIYALSGFCSALAGVVFTFYTLSGYALDGKGMELDAIATVVIGGTLLTGGAGSALGTVLGVLVYGTIQVLIVFQGTLNSWWTRIVIGFLVFLFCFLQRLFEARKGATAVGSISQEPAATAGG
ncbi:MAG TPA: galactofuranose ABC transporter, permease protein YjfF [Anaeromyxobacteraceae bacterium]|nr:galactofuranose ABC transporter, permease protein YjfF [Anaeromyxobacteraceae bacterium]